MNSQTPPKQRALVIGLTVLGCLLIILFGLRAMHAFRKFGGPPPPPHTRGEIETDVEKIRGWMTIPFISRMYGVPAEILFDAAGIPEEGNRKKNLEQLEKEFYPQASGLLMEMIKAAILAHQAPGAPDAPLPPLPPLTPIPPSP